jgi:hypothetical protein
MSEIQPFVFYTERRLVALTGIKACNLPSLLDGLQTVPGSSIFYHTHQQYLSHHFQKPVFYNDFAVWVSRALQEEELAEKLAAIDLLAFTAIRGLRDTIVAAVQKHLSENNGRQRECPPGDEFHFCKSQSFVMPTGVVAYDIPDFFAKIRQVTNVSLFFHFFGARLRLGKPTNDFSQWIAESGEPKLAAKINMLDPYVRTLEELQKDIEQLGCEYLGQPCP